MRGSILVSFLGISISMVGLVGGCGDDDDTPVPQASPAKSGVNESCTTRDDCEKGLRCFAQTCLEDPSSGSGGSGSGGEPGSGGSGGKGGSGGGSGGKGGSGGSGGSTTQSAFGGPGESCTKRADCQPGLGCYNQRCAETPGMMGEAGEGNVPTPSLGGLGETCVLSSDCEAGLACLPTAAGSVGSCTPVDTGIAPTGKVCGAECASEDDCCELPKELHQTFGASSCTELNELIGATDCSDPGTLSLQCFGREVYCDCADSVWSCSAAGRCAYRSDCSADGLVMDGCPTLSRAGFVLTSACDVGGSDKCAPPVGANACDSDADCEGLAVSDDGADLCEPDECVCYQSTRCLRKCDEDLDCAFGKRCDTQESVCVPVASCTSDRVCQSSFRDYRAICDGGTCTLPCENDLDCNPDGLVGGGFTMVCDRRMCRPLGCDDDNECVHEEDDLASDPNPRRMFCTEPPAPGMGASASSAITD
jgi:hypothetical protein